MTAGDDYNEQIKQRLAGRGDAPSDEECWAYTGARTANGYGHMSYRGRAEYTHRVAAVIYLGFDLGSGLVVRHTCDNPACWNPRHLAIGTQKENMCEAAERGRMRGKKLTPAIVAEIKYLLARGRPYSELAPRFGVSTTAIGQIARGQTWRDVPASAPSRLSFEAASPNRQEATGDPPGRIVKPL